MTKPKLAGMILAAGESTRFGGRKQLARINDKTMLRHAIDALCPAIEGKPFVVLGAYRDDIAPIIGDDATIVFNENWASGMGSSIAAGIEAVMEVGGYDGVLIALCDQIRLESGDFHALKNRFDDTYIVAAKYNDRTGAPAIFPAAFFTTLKTMRGPDGARTLLRGENNRVIAVDLPHARVDIDTQEDLEHAVKHHIDCR